MPVIFLNDRISIQTMVRGGYFCLLQIGTAVKKATGIFFKVGARLM
jgi:hypothetical protein